MAQSTSNLNLAIRLHNVGVEYDMPTDRINTIKEYSIRLMQGKIKRKKFWALKNVDLEISQGEIFGILGRNGAGKSTLLKVISRVLIPTEGDVWICGVVHPLLQLGAGFHPELTGRENIFLNGTILGHTKKEIEEKFDEIVDFSEIADFIESPLRTYSSGMKARLGFSVATAWMPDILVVDEVLGVGDAAFQQKCSERMLYFREHGSTIILVSHSPNTITNLCERAIWLDHGNIVARGNASEVSAQYNTATMGKRL
ncbi:MAG TPA: teichoic acid ABC transporter ATP-binding protein [Anaerolineaceae bacterium]|nr:teichoic acid ABC transporter ATP-binding protein [Anaerolineaceae bacterium]